MERGELGTISGSANPSEIEKCLIILNRINDRLDRMIDGEPGQLIRLKEAMRMTGCGSPGSFQRFKKEFGIACVNRGRFSRVDIENAIARRIHEKNLSAKTTAAENP